MFWKKNLSKSTIFGILEQIIRRRLIHSLFLKHLQIMIYQIRDLNQSNFFCVTCSQPSLAKGCASDPVCCACSLAAVPLCIRTKIP